MVTVKDIIKYCLRIFRENEKGTEEKENERMRTEIGEAKRGDEGSGRRGVPAAIIRVNYRAVSPFGELLIPSVARLRSLDRSSLNPVANLYHDRAPYRRTSTSESIETAGPMEFARRSGAKVSTTTTTIVSKYTTDIPNRLESGGTPCVISGWCPCIFRKRVKNTDGERCAGSARWNFRFVLACEKSIR